MIIINEHFSKCKKFVSKKAFTIRNELQISMVPLYQTGTKRKQLNIYDVFKHFDLKNKMVEYKIISFFKALLFITKKGEKWSSLNKCDIKLN